MSITTTTLTRGAGLSAVVAGLLFIVIQLIHPHEDVAAVTTTAWIVVALLTMAMSVLLLVGLTGMYLRQVTETGSRVWSDSCCSDPPSSSPSLSPSSRCSCCLAGRPGPRYVEDFLATFTGGTVVGDVGPCRWPSGRGGRLPARRSVVRLVLFRARILARWAACCLPSAPSPRSWYPSSRMPSTGSSPFRSDWLSPASDTRCGASRRAPPPVVPP